MKKRKLQRKIRYRADNSKKHNKEEQRKAEGLNKQKDRSVKEKTRGESTVNIQERSDSYKE